MALSHSPEDGPHHAGSPGLVPCLGPLDRVQQSASLAQLHHQVDVIPRVVRAVQVTARQALAKRFITDISLRHWDSSILALETDFTATSSSVLRSLATRTVPKRPEPIISPASYLSSSSAPSERSPDDL
eukprot:CAMPEP_0117680770 /NCGR_PEP_ID=MMETSP0804-20121206/18560_1 /TAXON_ID=1074897 /ORGANISM="Tetraselmis astigmatica, Strain CCMP880" /LENGTH=128 /DNA_ID=CAMNT_0005490351 /DNA_START=1517 /DNA_END=1904 /DNA_ORIENTATION=-